MGWGRAVLVLAAMSVTSMAVPPANTVPGQLRLAAGEALIMGGSGDPIPIESYADAVTRNFIEPHFPGYTHTIVPTPEGLYPVTGIKVLPADTSIAQGQEILQAGVLQQVAEGNHVVVSGFSQSSTISSLAMTALHDGTAGPGGAPSPPVDPTELAFVLTGDPSNPNGGLVARFGDPSLPHLTFPSLGQTFTGATPDDLYPTFIYTQEYDGFADFPRYPINILADLNAILGIQYVHGTYADLTPEQLSTAIVLPTEGQTLTTYYMIPTEHLPLLEPLRGIPVLGTPLADLLEPALRVLVNLGYGDPDVGWSTSAANIPTAFGLFPDVNPLTVLADLAAAVQQGVQAAIGDLGSLEVPDLSWDPLVFTGALPTLTDVVNGFSGALASAYAILLPTADLINTLVTTLPVYNISLFVQELAAGDLLNAVGLPIAADVGLAVLAAGFELEVIANATSAIVEDLRGLVPF